MKRFNLNLKLKLANICLALIALGLSVTCPVYGASVSFVPGGTQLDDDPPPDLDLKVGDTIDFSFLLDTSGLPADLVSLELIFGQDTTELETLSIARTDEDLAAFPNFTVEPVLGDIPSALFIRSGPPGVPANSVIPIVEGTFLALSGLTNDGLADFSLTVTSAIDLNGTDVTSLFQPVNQSLDVQPVPEPLTILGSFAALGFGALFKRELSKKKDSEQE